MEILRTLFENSQIPFLSAFILGVMTAISPCPLATNITAIGYISRSLTDRKNVFINGLLYTLGRSVSYTLLGVLLFYGTERFDPEAFFQNWGEKLIGPLLILIGLMMGGALNFIRLPFTSGFQEKFERLSQRGSVGSFLLGMLFALAFCPYSGVLYFGILIPMTMSSSSGIWLPFVFSVGTGLPVLIFAWLIAFSMGSLGVYYQKIKAIEQWFRRIVALLFVITGFYYSFVVLIKPMFL